MKRIFLDYASTTPLDGDIEKLMRLYLGPEFANPSALYQEGLLAKKAVQDSRESIAKILNIRAEEVIFTGSGSESDNLAIVGVFSAFKKKFKPHIITTVIEHPSIIEACKYLEQEGCEVSYIGVEENGIVDPQKIAEAIRPTTVLVSVMYANNEIGTIQPIHQIARRLRDYKERGISALDGIPYLHTDASQAANYLDLSFQKLGVDLMTLDASKIYGPKGVGALAVRRYVEIKPIIFGGGQANGLRAGTENVPGIVGLAAALKKAQESREAESARLTKLRDYFIESIIKKYPAVLINGDKINRLPNNVNICVPGLDAEFAVIKLDQAGVGCSSASACLNLSENSYSYVVSALGDKGKECQGAPLRFTLGRYTTLRELNLTLGKIHSIIEEK